MGTHQAQRPLSWWDRNAHLLPWPLVAAVGAVRFVVRRVRALGSHR